MDPIVLSTHTYRQGCCESLRGWRRKLMLPLPPAIIYCNWYIRACTTQTGVPTDGLKKVILRLKPEQMNSDRNGKLGMCVKHGTEICLPWTRLLSSLSPLLQIHSSSAPQQADMNPTWQICRICSQS